MKRKNNLYLNMCNLNIIKNTYLEVKRSCHNKKNIYKYDLYESINLYNILDKLVRRNYEFDKYFIFLIKEPKYRLIMSENINDKIVNHLISRCILIPSLEPKLIDTNVATRINKGTSYAFNFLIKYLNIMNLYYDNFYILKIDIKKYFYNINHDILFKMLKKNIKDKDALNIIFKVLNTTNDKYINEEIKQDKNKEIKRILSLNISNEEKNKKINEVNNIPYYKYNKGLGIGNMTNQILAIFFLNDIDHYIKEELKCKYYIRYQDDLVIIDSDKDRLLNYYYLIKEKIESLDLEINNKSRIMNIKRGFSFLGYTYKKYDKFIIKVNNITMKRIKRHLESVNYNKSSLISYKGFLMRANY